MPSSRILSIALLALGLAACSDQPSAPSLEARPDPLALQQRQEEVVPGEILIKMKDGVSLDVLTGATPGLRLERRLAARSGVSVLRVEPGRERAEAARLADDPRVEYAHPNYIRRISAIDPRLWAFRNPRDTDIDLTESIGTGGSQVVIGSLDTGVDTDHPEFAGKLILGWDWANNDTLPEDDNGHGTHTIAPWWAPKWVSRASPTRAPT